MEVEINQHLKHHGRRAPYLGEDRLGLCSIMELRRPNHPIYCAASLGFRPIFESILDRHEHINVTIGSVAAYNRDDIFLRYRAAHYSFSESTSTL